MALYRYEAVNNRTGKNERGTLDAGTKAEARASLRDKGFLATKLDHAIASTHTTKDEKGVTRAAVTWGQLSGQRLDHLVSFSRQLAMLLKAGLPVAEALTVLGRQLHDSRYREVIADITVRVKEGAS